jgi:hypothetical protein
MSVKEDVPTENPVRHPSSIRSMIQKYEKHLKPEGLRRQRVMPSAKKGQLSDTR